jgi:hypothetical protein
MGEYTTEAGEFLALCKVKREKTATATTAKEGKKMPRILRPPLPKGKFFRRSG